MYNKIFKKYNSHRNIKIILCLFFFLSGCTSAAKNEKQHNNKKYKIGVCDWMILKRQKIGSFELVNELKGDGVEIDMGSLGHREMFDNKFREEHFVNLFKEKSAEFDVQISSLAMSAFYGQSFVDRDNYIELVQDCINSMKKLDVNVAFLPLGVHGDLNKYPKIRPKLVKRLSTVGTMAEKAEVIIGIETSLDAKGEIELLNEINSPAIKIYYKFQNPLENGRNIYEELKLLGKDRICQIHCSDTDDVTLPHNTRLDMHRIKSVLDSMDWQGWLIIERSRDKDDVRNVKKNHGTNIAYLKEIFQ